MIRIAVKKRHVCSIQTFGTFLLSLEVLWILLYISLCIYSFVITTRPPFGGPMGENMRTDTFSLRTHIMVFNIVFLIQRAKPIWWMLPVLLFMLFSDLYNVIEMGWFSPVRDAQILWIFTMVVVSYQTTVTVLSNLWFLYMIYKDRVKQIVKV